VIISQPCAANKRLWHTASANGLYGLLEEKR